MKYFNSVEERSVCTHSYSPIKEWNNRSSRRKTIKKRKRKSMDQLKMLEKEFQVCTEWDKDKITKLSKKTGLSEAQIYKWSWDQKKKLQLHTKLRSQKDVHLSEIFTKLPDIQFAGQNKENLYGNHENLICSEMIMPRVIDYDFYNIQRGYRHNFEVLCQVKPTQDKCLDNFLEEFSRV